MKASIRILAALIAVSLGGCNVIDIALGRHAKIEEMVPGQSIGSGELDCWLTLRFDRIPEGVDPRDIRVHFESIALTRPADYDWRFIASHDVIANGTAFGSGYRANAETTARQDPPLGESIKVKFPLSARRKIEKAPTPLWLTAEVYWGGVKQHSVQRTIEHVYSHTEDGFF